MFLRGGGWYPDAHCVLCLHFYHAYFILFCHTNPKNVSQKEIYDRTFEVYLLTAEPSSWFLLIESLKMTCTRSYAWFLKFLSNREGVDCFLRLNILPKLSKITVTVTKVSKSERLGSILTCPKSAKWLLVLNCWKLTKWPVYVTHVSMYQKIYASPVMGKLETSSLNRQTSFKGFYWVLCFRSLWRHYLIVTWLWQISLSLVT